MGNSFGKNKNKNNALQANNSGLEAAKVGKAGQRPFLKAKEPTKPSAATSTASSSDSYDSSEDSDAPPTKGKKAWGNDGVESAMKASRGPVAQVPLRGMTNVVSGKIDGGCSTTMMSQRTYDMLVNQGASENMQPCSSVASVYKFANGETKKANCQVSISADINNMPAEVQANVFNDPNTHFLLGLNFLRHHKVSIQYHPDGDRINCPALGLYNRVLPRDTAGLDVLPFFVPFPGEANAGMEASEVMRKEAGKSAMMKRRW